MDSRDSQHDEMEVEYLAGNLPWCIKQQKKSGKKRGNYTFAVKPFSTVDVEKHASLLLSSIFNKSRVLTLVFCLRLGFWFLLKSFHLLVFPITTIFTSTSLELAGIFLYSHMNFTSYSFLWSYNMTQWPSTLSGSWNLYLVNIIKNKINCPRSCNEHGTPSQFFIHRAKLWWS